MSEQASGGEQSPYQSVSQMIIGSTLVTMYLADGKMQSIEIDMPPLPDTEQTKTSQDQDKEGWPFV